MWKKLFSDSEVAKNFAILLSGTLLAQVIPVMFSPILSRVYSPEDFGLFAIISAFVGILSVIACGRYELAIMLPKREPQADSLVFLGQVFSIFFSLLLGVVFFFFHLEIADKLNISQNHFYLFIVPPVILLIGIYQPFLYLLTRKKEFKKNSINKIVQTSAITILSFIFGVFCIKGGLVFGYFFGWLVLVIFSFYQVSKFNFSYYKFNISDFFETAKKYKEFPLYNSIPALLNSLSSTAPVFIISIFFNSSITGYFNLTRQIIAVPLSLITVTISQIYLERIASKKRDNLPIKAELKNLVKLLVTIAVSMIILVYFFGPFLFSFIFGKKWISSGYYAQILIFSYAIQFVVGPLGNVLTALNKIKIASLFPLIYFILVAILYFMKIQDIDNFLKFLTLLEIIAYCFLGILIYWAVNQYELEQNKSNR